MNHSEIVSFLWGVVDLIRDTFKRGKYQDVILRLAVLRRTGCVLAPTKGSRGMSVFTQSRAASIRRTQACDVSGGRVAAAQPGSG